VVSSLSVEPTSMITTSGREPLRPAVRQNAAVSYYIDRLASDPSALHGSFQMYRAFTTTAAQNEQRKTRRLTMPVLALAGTQSSGDMVAATVKLVAEDVQSVVFDPGHWIAEQAPDQVLEALTAFLAPYRDGAAAAQSSSPLASA
jgi:pimeloyl-ACP methyl ester carboxylesterase